MTVVVFWQCVNIEMKFFPRLGRLKHSWKEEMMKKDYCLYCFMGLIQWQGLAPLFVTGIKSLVVSQRMGCITKEKCNVIRVFQDSKSFSKLGEICFHNTLKYLMQLFDLQVRNDWLITQAMYPLPLDDLLIKFTCMVANQCLTNDSSPAPKNTTHPIALELRPRPVFMNPTFISSQAAVIEIAFESRGKWVLIRERMSHCWHRDIYAVQ